MRFSRIRYATVAGFLLLGLGACPIAEVPELPEKEPDQEQAATGAEGGECYGNQTCDEGLICENKICILPEPVDMTGQLDGSCYGNNTCNAGLICENGVCVEEITD